VEVIPIGNQRVVIKTSMLDDKATACSMICCYADELKEGFFPWVEEVAKVSFFLSFLLLL
jgi:importin-5